MTVSADADSIKASAPLSSVLEDFDFEELRRNNGSAELLDPPSPTNQS